MDIQDMCNDLSDECPNERYFCKKCEKVWYDFDKLEEECSPDGTHKNCGGNTVRQIPSCVKVEWMETRW